MEDYYVSDYLLPLYHKVFANVRRFFLNMNPSIVFFCFFITETVVRIFLRSKEASLMESGQLTVENGLKK
jgi:hypothetical protein